MALDRIEFEGMEFNPFKGKKDDLIWDMYPRLNKNPYFQKIKADLGEKIASDLMRFVIIYLDYESPLSAEKDMDLRKDEAMKMVGINSKHEAYKWIHKTDEHIVVRNLIREYIKYIASYDYRNWLALLTNQQYNLEYLMSVPTFSVKTSENDMAIRARIRKEVEECAQQLMQLEAKLFPAPRIEKMIKEMLMDDSFAGYAEKYASEEDN